MSRQIVVVGAGPAGSLAALLLSRGGDRVCLIEQHRFPRDKVCGECLSALGISVLERAGLSNAIRAGGAVELTRTILHAPPDRSAALPLPRPMWGISRAVFDHVLIHAARDAGVELRQPARCESLRTEGARPVLRVRDLCSNRVDQLEADWVIVADGKAGWCGTNLDPPDASGDFGIKTHFQDVAGPRDAIELFGSCHGYGGVAAIEDARWNAAFSVPGKLLRDCRGDIDSVFQHLVASNTMLARRLSTARQCGPWLTSPLPRFAVQRDWPDRVIPVGNAAAALEPIGGEGMGLALRSAELACGALAQPDLRKDAIVREYSSLWTGRRLACRGAARIATRPAWSRVAVGALRRFPSIGVAMARAMGK